MAVGIGNCHFPLRPILQKDLTVRSSETGTIGDIEEALSLTARGIVKSRVEMVSLSNLNEAMDRLKTGSAAGKLVVDLRNPPNGMASHVQKRMAVL